MKVCTAVEYYFRWISSYYLLCENEYFGFIFIDIFQLVRVSLSCLTSKLKIPNLGYVTLFLESHWKIFVLFKNVVTLVVRILLIYRTHSCRWLNIFNSFRWTYYYFGSWAALSNRASHFTEVNNCFGSLFSLHEDTITLTSSCRSWQVFSPWHTEDTKLYCSFER